MALRPINFSIPSSSELKVTFTDKLSASLSSSNFFVESLNGAVSNLQIRSVEINGNVALIRTTPQVSGNYYLLKFIDTKDQQFVSERNGRLIDDAVSRELFFVGIDNVNPIRDDMISKLPPLYDVENTNLKSILSAQAKELYRAQVRIGEILNDNYIYIDVKNERRVRSTGAFDRLANENVFDIYRVSSTAESDVLNFASLEFTGNSDYFYFSSFPDYPVSLQQKTVEMEEISLGTDGNSFDGYLITLKNKNVIKVLSIILVESEEEEDCNGNIGVQYDIEKYKYSIQSNYFDPYTALSFRQLESNQVLISEFGNVSRPKITDKIYVSYIYRDLGVRVVESTVDFFRIENQSQESIPSNTTRFFLNHAPIVSENGDAIRKNGVTFRKTENSNEVPDQLKIELEFNFSKLPSAPGEYAVNYETGEVYVYGLSKDLLGTGNTNYIASYFWKKSFKEDIDYSYYESTIASIDNRGVSGKTAIINFEYEQVFQKDIDYKISSHIEVMPESVENRISGYFSLKTQQAPITNVFKILNQTTGEIYNPVRFSETEIFFSGRQSPEIKDVLSEQAQFKKILNEQVQVIGEFINPIFEVSISSNGSNNAIGFNPPIPAELISYNSDQYFCRFTDDSGDEVETTDTNIIFFGTPNMNNLISTFAIPNASSPPSLGQTLIIGLRTYSIHLDEVNILNKNNDSLGNVVNSSLIFSDNEVFENEKYFEPLDINPDFSTTTNGKFSLALTIDKSESFYKSLSRLRNVGDYCVDYKNGIAYVSVEKTKDVDLGFVTYNCSIHEPSVFNVQNIYSVSKKYSPTDDVSESSVAYQIISNTPSEILVHDMDEGFCKFDNLTKAKNLYGEEEFVGEVLPDYTIVVPNFISGISAIIKMSDLTGINLNNTLQSSRHPESGYQDLVQSTMLGGKNIYNESVRFERNVIDLKKHVQRRVYSSGPNYEVVIQDQFAGTFVSATVVKTGQQLFSDELIIDKIKDISISSVVDLGLTADVEIYSDNSLAEIDASGDYLIDSDGNEFLITAFDSMTSTITVDAPSTIPVVNNDGSAKIIVKPTVTIGSGEISVSIPDDSPISDGELIEFVYITTDIPTIGEPVFVDYRYGSIYLDYSYVYDQISVWYEWGDNSIDWSINNSIEEGQEYFVSYRYGALRDALKRNFGILTGIPFLKEFSLDTDRELYRSALKGVMQVFPEGPTVSSYKQLVKSFTGISPLVNELAFGNWTLGGSHLSPVGLRYSGELSFRNAKHNEGLFIGDDTTVWMPTASNISFNEGTFESWVAPEWAGIWNDASITFELNNIGQENYVYNGKNKLFESGWEKLDLDVNAGRFDDSNCFIFSNFNSDNGSIEQGKFAILKEIKNANISVDFDFKTKFNIDFIGNNFSLLNDGEELSLSSEYKVLTLGQTDGHKFYGADCVLEEVPDFSYVASSTDYQELPDYEPPYPIRPCRCFSENTVSVLKGFDQLTVTITLSTDFDISSFLADNSIVDNSAESFILSNELNFYQVLLFVDDNGSQTSSIPDSISKIIVSRFPLNNPSLSAASAEEINNSIISGSINLYSKKMIISSSDFADSDSLLSTKQSYIVNWSKVTQFSIKKTLDTNRVKFSFNESLFDVFLTDCLDSDTIDIGFTDPENLTGILFALPDEKIMVTSRLKLLNSKVYNRFSLSDIWIGKDGNHPRSSKFTLNRFDTKNSPIGVHHSVSDSEGIFIGFDELCKSPVSNDIGQWIFRTRAARAVSVPDSVNLDSSTNFVIKNIDHLFSGMVTTSGEFSSVVRASRDAENNCSDMTCSSSFRYSGSEELEIVGWRSIEESDSDVVNSELGGMEGISGPWAKVGDFDTTAFAGIYRLGPSAASIDCVTSLVEPNTVQTSLECCDGNFTAVTSMLVASVDPDISSGTFAGFTGLFTGKYTGISPITINNKDVYVSVALGKTVSDNVVIILDKTDNSIIDMFAFDWDDASFHEYELIKDDVTGKISTYIDDILYSQVDISDFEDQNDSNPSFKIHLFDSDLVDSELFHDEMDSNQIHIDLVSFSSIYSENTYELESDDIFINTDDKISFEFNISSEDIEDYNEGGDPENFDPAPIASDEIMFTSDNLRYILDSKSHHGPGRFSIYKDGKGFLNFFVCENKLDDQGAPIEYNISYNIKNFSSGELHHVAASWRLNTIDEKDEMHLFVDGYEVPSIYKFGGKIPVSINNKFSDVSKESLWAFTCRDIEFCDIYENAITSASSNIFTCNSINFTNMLGLALTFIDSSVMTEEIGRAYYISSVINSNQVVLSDCETKNEITFNASASDISFKLFPIAGRLSPIMTDLRNEKFSIKRTASDFLEHEYGGIVYSYESGSFEVISGSNIEDIKFWANAKTRTIQFMQKNAECLWEDSASPTDTDIHIETYGLSVRRIKQDLNLSSSSYLLDPHPYSGKSLIYSRNISPTDLRDVSITRVLLPKTLVETTSPTTDGEGDFFDTFSITFSSDEGYYKVSSETSGFVHNPNYGRKLTLEFDSDNVDFSKYDEDETAIQDGTLDSGSNRITVYGETTDGIDEETFFIRKNGKHLGTKFFKNITSISGSVKIVDDEYPEVAVISLYESDSVTISNNSGYYAEVSSYKNGIFEIVNAENQSLPFELHPGIYKLDYPAYLNIDLSSVGKDLYIGSDYLGQNKFNGIFDEMIISSEISTDTRPSENYSGRRSITQSFNATREACGDSSIFTLVHFNSPVNDQIRRLRNTYFLDEISNYKYQLSTSMIESLIPYFNKSDFFISYLVSLGIPEDVATRTYFEVHYAGGAIKNEAKQYNNYTHLSSSSSVNDQFGNSALFSERYLSIENNSGQFREKEGSIEFWVSPEIDTTIDNDIRYYVDVYSAIRTSIKSSTSTKIELPNAARKILSVTLTPRLKEFSEFYADNENVVFDDIRRSSVSGVMEGGSGHLKEFYSVGGKLSSDGKTIYLGDALPSQNIDVIITYVPIDFSGDRVSIFKDSNSMLNFAISAGGIDNLVNIPISWRRNSWHKVLVNWKTGTKFDTMKIFVDGVEGGGIRFGEGLLFGDGYVYGQYIQGQGQSRSSSFTIPLMDQMRMISIGANVFGDSPSKCRMDNVRFSRAQRVTPRDSAGNLYDPNWSSNLNTVRPLVQDNITTLMLDFDANGSEITNFAKVKDPVGGIFDFQVEVIDEFGKVIGQNNGQVEDLIVDLVNRLKPAHTRAFVKFLKNSC